ncbi:MAG: UDP-N-acetylglucosamine 2-epimerase (non-hydrolyzing) [Hyphomicrobiales bacterium]|nr:UDP-N-acetylglucosamine 2-epimerase (non-hydrolyzing) [Hyphomicrobiales bacterium]
MMKVMVVLGTRPELIKLAPIVIEGNDCPSVEIQLLSTGQHRDMTAPLFQWFKLSPDFDLDLMKVGQTPQDVIARALPMLDRVLEREEPNLVLVQGDTSTALAATLAAFHRQIPVGHVEAGLRTGDLLSPFPEEMNRTVIGRMATWHFAPTERAAEALRRENTGGSISVVGNTVIDSLLWTCGRLPPLQSNRRQTVLVTTHRRESFGEPLFEAISAISDLAKQFPHIEFVFPVHRNPSVRDLTARVLENISNVSLTTPLDYPDMIDAMRHSCLIISDSGGIQEEAPSFGIPILILREHTERPEVIEAGVGELVGTNREKIIARARHFLTDPRARAAVAGRKNPFGDGNSAKRIIEIINGIQEHR